MDRIVPIEFSFKSKTYYALVRRRFSHIEGQYHVTVMNSGLETLLYGNDIIITDEEGKLHPAGCIRDSQAKELIMNIIKGLKQYFQENQPAVIA